MTYHQTKWPMGQVEMTAKTLAGSGRNGQRQRPGRDGGQGHRDFSESAKAIEGLGMHCMMRVSKVVRVMMDDETVFPFAHLTVEPGRSWRKKAKAFKNAGWIGRLGGAPSTVTATTSRGIW